MSASARDREEPSRPCASSTQRGLTGTSASRRDLLALRGPARRLALRPRITLPANCSGGHLTHFRGRGMEFDETRIYQPGDDIRQMDWRVTARSGQPHVKLFREERERPVWLWVDQGQSMRFGTRTAFKSVRAAEAAALLAWAAVDGGDRLGGLVFDGDRQRELPPRSRHSGALRLLEALASVGSTAIPASTSSRREQPLDRLARVVRPGSLVFLLSDFAGFGRQQELLLARLAAHNELVLVLVYDPLEADLPPAGRWPVSDGRRILSLNSGSREQVAAHRDRFAQHWQWLQGLAKHQRMHSFRLTTEVAALGQLEEGL